MSQFLVPERIEEYRGFGGVRIEDDIIVTDTGMECFTVVPRRWGDGDGSGRGGGISRASRTLFRSLTPAAR